MQFRVARRGDDHDGLGPAILELITLCAVLELNGKALILKHAQGMRNASDQAVARLETTGDIDGIPALKTDRRATACDLDMQGVISAFNANNPVAADRLVRGHAATDLSVAFQLAHVDQSTHTRHQAQNLVG